MYVTNTRLGNRAMTTKTQMSSATKDATGMALNENKVSKKCTGSTNKNKVLALLMETNSMNCNSINTYRMCLFYNFLNV